MSLLSYQPCTRIFQSLERRERLFFINYTNNQFDRNAVLREVTHIQLEVNILFTFGTTVLLLRMAHRKWKESKQQPSMLPGPAVPGSCLVSFHILWAILSTSTVHCITTCRTIHSKGDKGSYKVQRLSRRASNG